MELYHESPETRSLFAQNIYNGNQYLVFENKDLCEQYMSTNRACYEILHPNKNVCIVFDVDFSVKQFGITNVRRELESSTILDEIKKHLSNRYAQYKPLF